MPDIPSRIVPGAPPPPAPAKAQKKKRKVGKREGEEDPQTPATGTVEIPDVHAAALTDKAPGAEDVQAGSVADELLTHGKDPSSEPKFSPVVDLLNKRIKALTKKIVSNARSNHLMPQSLNVNRFCCAVVRRHVSIHTRTNLRLNSTKTRKRHLRPCPRLRLYGKNSKRLKRLWR